MSMVDLRFGNKWLVDIGHAEIVESLDSITLTTMIDDTPIVDSKLEYRRMIPLWIIEFLVMWTMGVQCSSDFSSIDGLLDSR